MFKRSMLLARAAAMVILPGCALLLVAGGLVTRVQAATFTVTRTDDPSPDGCAPADCSLREAVMAANGSPGSTVVLPAGTYTLTIPGADAVITNPAVGDLDILAPMGIVGAGVGSTIVQAGGTPFEGVHRVFDNHSTEAVRIANMTIRHGLDVEDGSGGCIRNIGALTLEFVTVRGCRSRVAGGGVASFHALTLFQVTITGNKVISDTGQIVNGGGLGGGPGPHLGASSTVNISYSVLIDNEARSAGDVDLTAFGGGFVNTATMHISRSIISGNTALNGGGGVSTGSMTITDTTITDNKAKYDVGGVDNEGVMVVSNSTFSTNVAGFGCVGSQCDRAYAGGVLNVGESARLFVNNSTFSGNRCLMSGGGLLNAAGVVTISSSTFAGNVCRLSAGVGASDTILMKNTIVANNTATDPSGGDTGGLITSQGYNLIQRTTGSTIGGDLTGNIVGQDPRLGPLQDNGGPTLTHALNPGSPALNAGNPAGCLDHAGAPLPQDQRGKARSQGGRCDIGAAEAGIEAARGLGDLDGNRKGDILFRHPSGAIYVWFMDRLSVSAQGPVGHVDGTWTVQAVADFDGDGNADILWRHTSGTIYIWLMSGTTVMGAGSPGTVDGAWMVQGIGDFNADNRGDILWRHTSGALYIWFMSGTSIASEAPMGAVTTDWAIRGVGDFDGNGRPDILWRHSSGVVSVWLMNGTSLVGSGSPGGAGSDWVIERVADFDGDGKTDIAWRHATGTVYVWLMNGVSRSAEGSPGMASPDWTLVGAVDFDADARADLLWRHTSGLMYVWLMDGVNRGETGSPGAPATAWTIP